MWPFPSIYLSSAFYFPVIMSSLLSCSPLFYTWVTYWPPYLPTPSHVTFSFHSPFQSTFINLLFTLALHFTHYLSPSPLFLFNSPFTSLLPSPHTFPDSVHPYLTFYPSSLIFTSPLLNVNTVHLSFAFIYLFNCFPLSQVFPGLYTLASRPILYPV